MNNVHSTDNPEKDRKNAVRGLPSENSYASPCRSAKIYDPNCNPELRFYARRTRKNNSIVFASGRDIKERGDSSATSKLCRFHSPSPCKSMDPKLRSGMSPDNPELPHNTDLYPEYEHSFFPADSQQTLEWIAVLSSQSIPFFVRREFDVWVITVPRKRFIEAKKNIEEYESERGYFEKLKYKAKNEGITLHKSYTTLFVAVVLIFFFRITGPIPPHKSIWFDNGVISADKILNGEWWRLITGLTLHADLIHVLSNSIFLVIFASSLCFTLGSGLAWFIILSAAVMGNYSTLLIYKSQNHCSLGASTAVFAALGLLGAIRTLPRIKNIALKNAVMPFAAAVVILTFTGVGDMNTAIYGLPGESGNTDVMAHLMGFVWGLIIGASVFHINTIFYSQKNTKQDEKIPAIPNDTEILFPCKNNLILQISCGLIALFTVLFAWFNALH